MRYLTKKDLSILLGNALDNFDTSIYAFLAPLLAPVFFPNQDPIVQLILAYSVMMISMFARPLGAFIFGVIARKKGPICGLSYSLIGVAIATVYTGFLPGYEAIGWCAPLCLVLVRFVKATFAAGESTIAKLYLMEDKADHREALKVSHLYQSSSMLGTILASAMATTIIAFYPEAWRLCFWTGGITGFLGYFLRRYSVVDVKLPLTRSFASRIHDLSHKGRGILTNCSTIAPVEREDEIVPLDTSPLVGEVGLSCAKQAKGRVRGVREQNPFNAYQFSNLKSIWINRLNIFRVAMGTAFGHLTYSIPFVFMNSFVPLITSISLETMMVLNTTLLVFDMIMIPFLGRWLIKFEATKVMITASVILTLTIIPFFSYLPDASLAYVVFVRFWIVFWGVVFLCPLNFWFKSLFNTPDQYLLVGMGAALGASTIGRLTTPLCLWLWYVSELSIMPALYVGVITLVTAYAIQGTSAERKRVLKEA